MAVQRGQQSGSAHGPVALAQLGMVVRGLWGYLRVVVLPLAAPAERAERAERRRRVGHGWRQALRLRPFTHSAQPDFGA